MTLIQGLAFGLIGGTLLLFIWGKLRYDLVSLGSLMAGVLMGVPALIGIPAAIGGDLPRHRRHGPADPRRDRRAGVAALHADAGLLAFCERQPRR